MAKKSSKEIDSPLASGLPDGEEEGADSPHFQFSDYPGETPGGEFNTVKCEDLEGKDGVWGQYQSSFLDPSDKQDDLYEVPDGPVKDIQKKGY